MKDVVVIGAGPAGMCASLALADRGVPNTILAAPHRPAGDKPDTRTAALFNPSIQLLDNIGVWRKIEPQCAPLKAIRLVDETGGIFRAPEVNFSAREIGHEVFGFNIPQGPLIGALRDAIEKHPGVTVVETLGGVQDIDTGEGAATLKLAEGPTISARLIVAADGRNSISRKASGIAVQEMPCGQTAIACAFIHSRDHGSVSTEFHRRAGPLTVVPMPGRQSSLVWVERPEVAQRLAALTDEDFVQTLERNLHGLLGKISDPGPRVMFPLTQMSATSMGANRIALVGEAAHAIPPIGAQGLNLSLRDVAVLADLTAEVLNAGNDPGSTAAIATYSQSRLMDAKQRSFAVGSLNGALVSDLFPVQMARGAGLHLINAIAPLRQSLMRLGMAPPGDLPTLMQPRT